MSVKKFYQPCTSEQALTAAMQTGFSSADCCRVQIETCLTSPWLPQVGVGQFKMFGEKNFDDFFEEKCELNHMLFSFSIVTRSPLTVCFLATPTCT